MQTKTFVPVTGNSQTLNLRVPPDAVAGRLDKTASALTDELSRTRIRALIEDGAVTVNGAIVTDPAMTVSADADIAIIMPPATDAHPVAQSIPLDILLEDDDIIVINKAAGMTVHPGAGTPDGTLVNALLHHCGDTLSGIGGVKRPGIVHRLDKDTTGALIIAKNDHAHAALQQQIEDRSMSRLYHAVVLGLPVPPVGAIDRPIGRHPTNRLKQTIRGRDGRNAVTHYKIMRPLAHGQCALVACRLETGRTHQIRVHMESIKHPLLGDPLYGPPPTALRAALKRAGLEDESLREQVIGFPRQALHAAELRFIHPTTDEEIAVTAPYPSDFQWIIDNLAAMS